MTTVLILAIVSHIGYALNDFSGALGSRRINPYSMSLLSWGMGSVLYIIASLFLFRNPILVGPFLVTVLLAAALALAYPLFLVSVQKGNATINGVIGGIFPIWTVLFSIIFYNESLSLPEVTAITIIMIGVALSALHLTRKTRLRNLLNRYSAYALGVSLIWGICFGLLRYPVDNLGWFETGFIQTISGAIFSILWLYPKTKSTLKADIKKFYKYPVFNALSGFVATTCYMYAITKSESSIVAPIAGSYSALYAILSYFAFKEKLTKLQILGILTTVIGITILSFLVASA